MREEQLPLFTEDELDVRRKNRRIASVVLVAIILIALASGIILL